MTSPAPSWNTEMTYLRNALLDFETAMRYLDPSTLTRLRKKLTPHIHKLGEIKSRLKSNESAIHPPPLKTALLKATLNLIEGLTVFITPASLNDAFSNTMKATRKINQGLEILYGHKHALPEIDTFFGAPETAQNAPQKGSVPCSEIENKSNGLIHCGDPQKPYDRENYSIYIPETDQSSSRWPLVVVLHGGWGHGRDFIWQWLREARLLGSVVLSPSSIGRTWSIAGPDIDYDRIMAMIQEIKRTQNIDCNRILLTGFSDGATYALRICQRETSPFTAFAPISGVLADYRLHHVKSRRIYWSHGEQDWMFPIKQAELGYQLLSSAGADITFSKIPQLSHAYPREQNLKIWDWFCMPTP